VPAQDRLNTWTLGGIAIDQVSTYSTQAYQEDGSWQAHAQRRSQRCKQPITWRPLLSSSLQRSDSLMVQTFIYPRSCMARKCGHDEGGQRQDVSGRKESSPQHSALHPRDCSSDVLYGDTTSTRWPLMPNCVGTDARTWRLADGPGGARFSFEGMVSAGLWHGLVR
jgi:hypothetical protein